MPQRGTPTRPFVHRVAPGQRAIDSHALVIVAIMSLGTSPLWAQDKPGGATDTRRDPPGLERSAASTVTVVTKDASGNRIAKGVGFFIDIGRLVVARALLRDRAYSASVVFRGQEQRVTAVLADDARAGLALVAVNLPDGAPPAIRTRSARASTSAGMYHALTPESGSLPIEVSAEREVPGFGPVCATVGKGQPPSGTPVVDDDGEIVGVLVHQSAGDEQLSLLVPASRVLRLPPVGAVTIGEWRGRPEASRPLETEAAFLHGVGASLGGRSDEAARSFRQAAGANATDAEAHAALGASELAAGHPDAAFVSYRAAIAADPTNARFHHDLGVALSDAGRWDEAAGEFADVARLRPMDAEAHFNLGTAYGQLGRYEDEYSAYHAALRENSTHVKALRNLGIVCIVLKRYAEAVEVSARALRLLPADAQLHAQLGVAYYDLGNYQTAIDELKKAVALEPGFVKGHYGLALVYAASGQREAALAECETLNRLDPERGREALKMVAGRRP